MRVPLLSFYLSVRCSVPILTGTDNAGVRTLLKVEKAGEPGQRLRWPRLDLAMVPGREARLFQEGLLCRLTSSGVTSVTRRSS